MLPPKATDVPRRNIEIKARLSSLEGTRKIARALTGVDPDVLQQRDTYFHCHSGRLKMREIDRLAAQLIWYQRADQASPRGSDYMIVDVANPSTLRHFLKQALGARAVVEKRREIYLYHNVRIHLDDVSGLGRFVEFEAVLDAKSQEEGGHRQVEELCRLFGLSSKEFVDRSYLELIGP